MVMSLAVYVAFATIIAFALFARFLFLLATRHEVESREKTRPAKTMIILGSGGHTTEILRIVNNLNFTLYTPRIYVHACSDTMSVQKLQELEENSNGITTIPIFRSREVGQSYFTSIGTTLIAIRDAFSIVLTQKPDLILCNGPGTCVPLCLVAFFMKYLFLINTKIIFIESFCRVKSLSLTGKILYYFANHIITQWPKVCASNKPHVTLIK